MRQGISLRLNHRDNHMLNKVLSFALFGLALCVTQTGCQRQPTGAIQPAQVSSETFQVQGDYEMHYNALRTDQLTVDIARAYGIERSKNKVLLNVSVLNKSAGSGTGKAVDADVQVTAKNLNGQIKDVTLRRIAEEQAIYYIGEVGFSGSETLVFDISATPSGATTPIKATLTREFFSD
jgi:hypothetical protein